jgi:lysylphosphatidylglycerol synthetase-like protein (DUF2156 family)
MTLNLPRLDDSWSKVRHCVESAGGRVNRRNAYVPGLLRRLLGLAYELTPQVFAVVAFCAGALMLISAVTPEFDDRLRQLTGVVSPILIDLSHFVASIARSRQCRSTPEEHGGSHETHRFRFVWEMLE